MITPEYCRYMASYNRWQNESLYNAADQLSHEDRNVDRGSFFHSIQATLNHLLWGDKIWLSRFDDTPIPNQESIQQSINECGSWDELKAERLIVDNNIDKWVLKITLADLTGDLTWYSGAIERNVTKPKSILVMQLFNHQTHHRGQVHAMLTSVGTKPGDTDIPFMPDSYLISKD